MSVKTRILFETLENLKQLLGITKNDGKAIKTSSLETCATSEALHFFRVCFKFLESDLSLLFVCLLQVSLQGLSAENNKLQEALKMAVTDNKALISQQKEAIAREREKLSSKIDEQDKILKSAKDAMLKELGHEKSSIRQLEKEK